ncbi:FecR family protein [Myxacorys almedinensis]|uniref:FecR protein domain-containing protein n=1 Tax=Myxacorys almedinensis A TaxID=2690445 RepID=A0A8J7Z1J8_9CYAN|nr:FecR family protein [Myxacorys almedinensis]NDJ16091.1 hypothetical protein [Myxacorys almedinensis A]
MPSKLFLTVTATLYGVSAAFFSLPVRAQTVIRSAEVREVVRQVRLQPRNQGLRDATVRDKMFPEDALWTSKRSRAGLRFNDGSYARVGELALFRFTPGTRNFRLNNGTVLLLIKPGQGSTRIDTPNASAGVRGSALFVRYDETTKTTLVGALTNNPEGPMEVTAATGEKQLLEAGQMAIVDATGFIRRYRFDIPTFYDTSDMARGLDLPLKEQLSPDPAIAAVQRETADALRQQKPLDPIAVIENPSSTKLSPSATPLFNGGNLDTVAKTNVPPSANDTVGRKTPSEPTQTTDDKKTDSPATTPADPQPTQTTEQKSTPQTTPTTPASPSTPSGNPSTPATTPASPQTAPSTDQTPTQPANPGDSISPPGSGQSNPGNPTPQPGASPLPAPVTTPSLQPGSSTTPSPQPIQAPSRQLLESEGGTPALQEGASPANPVSEPESQPPPLATPVGSPGSGGSAPNPDTAPGAGASTPPPDAAPNPQPVQTPSRLPLEVDGAPAAQRQVETTPGSGSNAPNAEVGSPQPEVVTTPPPETAPTPQPETVTLPVPETVTAPTPQPETPQLAPSSGGDAPSGEVAPTPNLQPTQTAP